MGASMDSGLLNKGVEAHHKAIGAVTEANLAMSKAAFETINAAIGRRISPLQDSQTLDVDNAFSALVPGSAAMPDVHSERG